MPLVALFTVLAAALFGVAVWSATAGEWVIGACAAAIGAWFVSVLAGLLRKTGR